MSHAFKSQDEGKSEAQDWLTRVAIEAGHEVPQEALGDEPDLREDLSFYLNAYYELSTARPTAFSGVAPIPWKAVIEYAKFYGLDEEQLEDFSDIISQLDSEFRKFIAAESDKKDEAKKASQANDRTRNKSNHRPGHVKRRGQGSKRS